MTDNKSPYSKMKMNYNIEYAKKHLKRIPLDVSIEKYEEIKSHAQSKSEPINTFIKRAIDETIQRDNSAT